MSFAHFDFTIGRMFYIPRTFWSLNLGHLPNEFIKHQTPCPDLVLMIFLGNTA